jgi:two-component system, sensor histidine kinase LadS
MAKNFFLTIFNILVCICALGQEQKSNTLNQPITLPFQANGYQIPANTIVNLQFIISNTDSTSNFYYLVVGSEQLAILYEHKNNEKVILGKLGLRVRIPERSVKDDLKTIEIKLKGKEQKSVSLQLSNNTVLARGVYPQWLNFYEYQQKKILEKNNFHDNFWNPLFLILLILVLLLVVIQYIVLPEKVLIYYFFYVLFTFIRSSAANEHLVLENWFPFLSSINYSSLSSQVFTFLSFIFYVQFLREFTGFPVKEPKLDIFFKIEIVYLVGFIIFDLLFTITKYTNPEINKIFRLLELFGLLLGGFNLCLLLKVNNSHNKYIIIGAFSLLIIAILGQEIFKRIANEAQAPEYFHTGLAIIWSVGYIVELSFFTLALIKRQRNLLKSIAIEQEKNQNLSQQLETITEIENNALLNDSDEFDSFTLATSKGVLVFKQNDIIRLEASGNYTYFSINNIANPTLGSYSIADFEPKLNPKNFLRVHKSHVVNMQYVIKYQKGDGGTLTLQDGMEIPVSRSRKEELLKRL